MPYPSVLLHDHLDGGMRPRTVLELADEQGGHDLPSDTAQGLAAWFDQSRSGSLEPGNHSVGAFYRAGFNVTLSTDNRLMSATAMSDELDFVTKDHRFETADLARTTWRSLDAASALGKSKLSCGRTSSPRRTRRTGSISR